MQARLAENIAEKRRDENLTLLADTLYTHFRDQQNEERMYADDEDMHVRIDLPSSGKEIKFKWSNSGAPSFDDRDPWIVQIEPAGCGGDLSSYFESAVPWFVSQTNQEKAHVIQLMKGFFSRIDDPKALLIIEAWGEIVDKRKGLLRHPRRVLKINL